jgi:hypothetical protein
MPCSVSRSGWIFTIHLLIWIKQRRREDPMVLVHAAADAVRRALAAGSGLVPLAAASGVFSK